MSSRSSTAATLALSLCLLPGCASPAREAPTYAVRDSLGVRISESAGPVDPTTAPSIAEPLLVLGDGEISFAEVTGAVRLSDGTVVVADAGNFAIRAFSPEGELVATSGSEGDGPGEYRILQALGALPGDTVWTYDFSHRRVSVLGPGLRLIRSVTLGPPLSSGLAVAVVPGDTIVIGEAWSSARAAGADEEGLHRAPVAYARYDRSGAMIDTVTSVPGREIVIRFEENGRGIMGPAPLGRTAVHALVGGLLALSDRTTHEVRLHATDGALRSIVRWDGGDLAVDEALVRAWRDTRLADATSAERPRLERELAEVDLPEERPAHGPILGGPGGSLWVSGYAPNGVPPRWEVFDAVGRWLHTVEAPAGFVPLEIGDGWVLGLRRDDLGVETVELRPLGR